MRRLSVLAFVIVVLAAGGMVAQPHVRQWLDGPTQEVVDGPSLMAELPIDPAGDELLVTALAKLSQRSTVTARIRLQAQVGRQEFFGHGTYRQQVNGDRRKVKWLLESQRDGMAATLLQVSDGRWLWTDRRLPNGRKIERVDLWRVRRKIEALSANTEALAPGEANWTPFLPELATDIGGVAMLLGSLRESFEFSKPRLFAMGQTPVYAVIGRWRPEVLAKLLGKEASTDEPSLKQLAEESVPKRIPHHVLVLVGQRDAFPYVVEYRSGALGNGDAIADELFQPAEQPLARLEFYEVDLQSPIDNREFHYSPPIEPEWTDSTASFVERVNQSRRYEIARQSDGAAR